MSTTKTAKVRTPKVGANPFSINLADESSDSLNVALGIKADRMKTITDDVQNRLQNGGEDAKVSTLLHDLGEAYPNPNERALAVYTLGNIHGVQSGGIGDMLSKMMSGEDKGEDMPGWGASMGDDDDETSENAGV